MNLAEVWFGIVERQAIRRGVFPSVKDLNAKIHAFIDRWNDRAHPFIWAKTAEQVLQPADLIFHLFSGAPRMLDTGLSGEFASLVEQTPLSL